MTEPNQPASSPPPPVDPGDKASAGPVSADGKAAGGGTNAAPADARPDKAGAKPKLKGADPVSPKASVRGKDAAGVAKTPSDPEAKAGDSKQPRKSGRLTLVIAVLALLVAIGASYAAWQVGVRDARTLARRVQDGSGRIDGIESRLKRAEDLVRDLSAKTKLAEDKLAEARGQQAQLEKLYKTLSTDSAESVLSDLEGSLSLAAQQLASGGSSQGALLALQSAELRLARLDDPALLGVARAIARDVERLRSSSGGDIGALAARLDVLAGAIDSLPLVQLPVAESSAPDRDGADPEQGSGWRRWVRVDLLWREISSLFRVRRIDNAEGALVAPSQAYFLRQNLRLRLLNARLALLSRNDALFRADIERASGWLQRYFDRSNPQVVNALDQLRQLGGSRAVDNAPTISESLAAIRSARAARDAAR
ncbi:MAG: uroporphyrinogen-III C-methyltransferase [Burkholderiaceae bacterium]|nr:uroporphyrinogen-III C-methyltransferase [Burkholderiaceae bacterium]